jgi:hypothetical protein
MNEDKNLNRNPPFYTFLALFFCEYLQDTGLDKYSDMFMGSQYAFLEQIIVNRLFFNYLAR